MKKITKLLFAAAAAAAVAALAVSCSPSKGNDAAGPIKVPVPERPAGQQDALQMRAEKIDTVRIGFIGLGMRGSSAVARYTYMPGTKITALCDVEPDRVEKAQKTLADRGLPAAKGYSGSEDAWKELCESDDVDLVYVCTPWLQHAPMGIYAMEHGKHVAIEVPAATNLDEIWALINTCERTRRHCMMLENCCYDFFEMTTLNMAKQGVFGEVLHCEGAYLHDLNEFWNAYWRNWRMDFNRNYGGDVYPTHGLGPVCQVLDIHRGDRMKTLVAMDTKAVNGPAFIKENTGEDVPDFQNGDITTTMIRTEKGRSILIEHGVMTPRPYSRMYQVVGTEGYAAKYPVEQYCLKPENAKDGAYPDQDDVNIHRPVSAEVKAALQEAYRSPILTPELEETAKAVGGHGGMDFIMDYRLIYCLRNGLPLDMDVYDLAEWCCLGELGRISIGHGGCAVEVPDFTRGAWDRIQGFSYAFAE